MTKKEFIQQNIMRTYERILKEAAFPVTPLAMIVAVKQLSIAWEELTVQGYGAATKITSTMQQQATTNTDPKVLLDDGKHKNKSVEHWDKKLKEAQGNKDFDNRDLTEIRSALTSAEVSRSMGFGFYK